MSRGNGGQLRGTPHDPPRDTPRDTPHDTRHAKRYDERYYQRWYRDPRTRVKSPAELARLVALVLAQTEYHLERPLRSVLDIGCGEGRWYPALKRLRPKVSYRGVDPSAWAVARHGRRRHLQCGSIDALDALDLGPQADLVVLNDVIQYIDDATLARAAPQLRARCRGVIFANAFVDSDEFIGDRTRHQPRSADWYLKLFACAGWRSIGAQCYLAPDLASRAAGLELFD